MVTPILYILQSALLIIPLAVGLYLVATSYDNLREDHAWFMNLLRCRRGKVMRVRVVGLTLIVGSFIWAFFWAQMLFGKM